MKHGKGKMNLPSGEVYLTIWEYDRMNGKGTYQDKNGAKMDVVWYDDVMVPLI